MRKTSGCSNAKALVSKSVLSCSKLKFHIYTEHQNWPTSLHLCLKPQGRVQLQWPAEGFPVAQLHGGENSVRQVQHTGTHQVVSPELVTI